MCTHVLLGPSHALMTQQDESVPKEVFMRKIINIFCSQRKNNSAWHSSPVKNIAGNSILSGKFMRSIHFYFQETLRKGSSCKLFSLPFHGQIKLLKIGLLLIELAMEIGYRILDWLIDVSNLPQSYLRRTIKFSKKVMKRSLRLTIHISSYLPSQ